jgi:putative hydrolase of the HAD superfamily
MARVSAIVFDVGGTLLCPVEPIGVTYARLARAHGGRFQADAATEAFRHAMKSAAPRAKAKVPSDGDDRARWKEIVRLSLPAEAFARSDAFDAFFEEAYLHYARPDAWELYPEVLEVFAALRDYPVDLVVLSNWDSRLHPVLDGLGLGEFLPRRFISAELGWEKPDPAIYRHVAESLKIAPGQLLSVGDDAKNDVDAPRKAGWQVIGIERPKKDLWQVVRRLR